MRTRKIRAADYTVKAILPSFELVFPVQTKHKVFYSYSRFNSNNLAFARLNICKCYFQENTRKASFSRCNIIEIPLNGLLYNPAEHSEL